MSGLTIQGITFTGTLSDLPFNLLLSAVAVVSAPGFGVVFDDCYFVNLGANTIVSTRRLSTVPPENYPTDSGSVTLRNSFFKNVVYKRQLFYTGGNNRLQVEKCAFEKIAPIGNGDPLDPMAGSFFECRTADLCTFKTSCLSDVTWAQYLFIQVNYNATQEGTNTTNVEGTEFEFENNFGSNYINGMDVNGLNYCPQGFGMADYRADTSIPPGFRIEDTSCQAPPGFDAPTCQSNAQNGEVCLNPFWSNIIPFLFPC